MKSKKIIRLISLFMLVVVLAIGLIMNSVNALTLGDLPGKGVFTLGEVVYVGYNDLRTNPNLYCVQKGKSLSSTASKHLVKNFVYIDGNTATITQLGDGGNTTVKTVDNTLNGQVAWLVAKSQGYGTSTQNPSGPQQALWHILNNWFQILGLDSDYWNDNGNDKYAENDFNTKAAEYANNIGTLKVSDVQNDSGSEESEKKDLVVVDKTNRTGLKVDGGLLGPFKWEFEGKVTDIKVNGSSISTISTGAGSCSVSDLGSGDEFYISFSGGKLESMELFVGEGTEQKENTIYVAELYFLTSDSTQNLMYVNAGGFPVGPQNGHAISYYDMNFSAGLKLVKVDSRNNQIPLEGVGFKFRAKVMKYEKTRSTYSNSRS